tara:strand:- start:48 stop:455 length:408 start_codon:yes stop_codon:yes gene_type:complete
LINILKRQTREESKLLKKNLLFLKRKKIIDSIFKNGKYFKEYPLSVRFLQLNEANDINFVISVKKKYLPKAVDRNKIKRLMRNSVRECVAKLNNKISVQKKNYHIAIIYNSSIIYNIDYLNDKINLILTRLIIDE